MMIGIEVFITYLGLLPTGSEEREVLGVGSIPVAILTSCQDMNTLRYNVEKFIAG